MSEIIPPVYRPPFGGPLRWQDEQSGKLPTAVLAFFEQRPLSQAQFTLLRSYLIYYINAPCWDLGCQDYPVGQTRLADLRIRANALQSAQDIMPWIRRCLEVGIDPL